MNQVEKKSKTWLLIGVVVILLLIIAGLVGYIFLGQNGKEKEAVNILQGKKKKQDDKKVVEPIELTADQKKEIALKINNILFKGYLNSTDTFDVTSNAYGFYSEILKEENVTDEQKALIALNLVDGSVATPDRKQKAEVDVFKSYKDYFGESWKDVNLSAISYCPRYSYNSSEKVFYADSACGGTTSMEVITHIDNFQIDNDIAVADLYVVVTVPKTEDVNGDRYVTNELAPLVDNVNKNLVIDTVPAGNSYKITDANKDRANKYRFTFKKAEDGTFYYYSVKNNK